VSAEAGPVIVGADLGPGHDGQAELVLELAYPNGGRTQLSVTQGAVAAALDAAGVDQLGDLVGRPWTVLLGDRGDRGDRSSRS
jgi:hypothetical protein